MAIHLTRTLYIFYLDTQRQRKFNHDLKSHTYNQAIYLYISIRNNATNPGVEYLLVTYKYNLTMLCITQKVFRMGSRRHGYC